jgi:hypothetical protein
MFEARFQTFEDASARAQSAARVATLRAELQRRGLDGFVIPRADRQQNEYLPASEERLAWLTGFTGSAGAAVVLRDAAAIFVDGRYTLQADAQVDGKLFSIEHLVERPPDQWITDNLKSGAKLGYDPWLHTSEQAERLKKACAAAGAELVAVDSNPIDALWQDRPPSPASAVSLRDPKLAGEAAPDKLKRIRAEITKLRAETAAMLPTRRSRSHSRQSRGTAGLRSTSTAPSSTMPCGTRSRPLPTFARRTSSPATWKNSRARLFASTRRAQRMLSPRSSRATAASLSADRIPSRY